MINEINYLRHENEQLAKMFKTRINESNELYKVKIIAFNKQILYKNNKLLEYNNKKSEKIKI